MFCSKCGVSVGGESIFCHSCGFRIPAETPLPAVPDVSLPAAPEIPTLAYPVTPETGIAPEQASLFPENTPVTEPTSVLPPELIKTPEPEPLPAAEAKEKREKSKSEKEYFGKPALIFCLVIIALLSISTGVFAMLYFGGF